MNTAWRHNPGEGALVDHDYEMDTSEGSRTSPETTSSSEFSSSPGPTMDDLHSVTAAQPIINHSPGGDSLGGMAYSSSPDEVRSGPAALKRLRHLAAPPKRRRVNSEPGGGELLRLGLVEGRGLMRHASPRKPRLVTSISESEATADSVAPYLSVRERKKEQNKDAAKRYRQRKKSDRFVLDYELQRESGRNASLQREMDSLAQQIDCLKRCLREAAAVGGAVKGARDSPLGILAEVAAAQIPDEEEDVDVVSNEDPPKPLAMPLPAKHANALQV